MKDPGILFCPSCEASLVSAASDFSEIAVCPNCARSLSLRLTAFPALVRDARKGVESELIIDGEAGCFQHPGKKATVVCELCGRFLCSLCDISLAGQHLCPGCIESGRKKKKISALEHEKIVWDNVALALALFVITAPGALIVAKLRWNKPSSLVRRTNTRLVVAVIIVVLQMLAVGFVLWG